MQAFFLKNDSREYYLATFVLPLFSSGYWSNPILIMRTQIKIFNDFLFLVNFYLWKTNRMSIMFTCLVGWFGATSLVLRDDSWLCLEIHSGRAWGPYRLAGIETRLAICKASLLLTVLSLNDLYYLKLCLWKSMRPATWKRYKTLLCHVFEAYWNPQHVSHDKFYL